MEENRIKRFNENSELNISDVSDSKLFTYKQVHKFLRDFNFQYSWIEPEELEKWIKHNVK